MSQNHSLTKRNRRQKSHTRGHEGRATQLALRSTEAQILAALQEYELNLSWARQVQETVERKQARLAKRAGVGK